MALKIIQEIKPFNQFFYKSCFYNALFSVLEWMDRSIYPHISNDIMFYSQDEEVPGMLDMTYYPFRDPELIFKEENYEVCTSRRQENIIEYLVSSIHQNKPVIIWVDCFYEDIRLDMYHKEHWAHTLLIVGYNDDTKQFAIMEHSNKESLNYGLKWISYSSLKESYDAFFQLDHADENLISTYRFESKQEPFVSDWIETYEYNIFKHRAKYTEGIKQLEQYSAWFGEKCLEEGEIQAYAESIFLGFNRIVAAKQVECARYFYFDSKPDRLQTIGEILDAWKNIRATWGKLYFSDMYSPNQLMATKDILNRIMEMEKRLIKINGWEHINEY